MQLGEQMYETKQYIPKIHLLWKQEAYYDDAKLIAKTMRTEYRNLTQLFDSMNLWYFRQYVGDYIGQVIGRKNIYTRLGLNMYP